MQKHIDTEYSNQLHQLLVSISKHLYFGSDGNVKYQEKAMVFNINNCHKSRKEHLVYYILRDHYSGSFTFRIATTKKLIPLADFLYYAWSKDTGEEKFLWGMPDSIFIPKMISTDSLFSGLKALKINPLNPPSGFASGIRIIRDIEDNLCFNIGRTVDHKLEGINKLRPKVYRYLIYSSYRDNKFAKWQTSLPTQSHPRAVPTYSKFVSLFSVDNSNDSGLALFVNQSQKDIGVHQKKHNPIKEKYSPFSEKKLNQAQQLIYNAWEEPNREKCLTLARKALRISPYCADAYNLLAEKSDSLEERQNLFEQGVKAGRASLGDLFFRKHVGHFWGIIETRPFMRSLSGLSECLWENGQRQEAITYYKELLHLNPNDNQGVRYTLVNCLLSEGMYEEADKLLSEYQESSCFILYSQALVSFYRKEYVNADKYLKEALLLNPHVPPYLLGIKHIPWSLPAYYSHGSTEEAIIYAADALDVWKSSPRALAWLDDSIKNSQ